MHPAQIFLAQGRAFREAARRLEAGDPIVEMNLLIHATRMLVRAERHLGRADEPLRHYLRQNLELQTILDQAPERPPRLQQRELARRTVDRLILQVGRHMAEALPGGHP